MTSVKRRYDGAGRREQARVRRLAVVVAARDLFLELGFRRTTVAAVAERAGVSAESIYKGFGTKAALAKAAFDLAVAGDDEPVAVADRPQMQALREEPDVRRKIAMFLEGLAQRQARSADVQILVRDGRHVDEALVPVWQAMEREGLAGMTALAGHLAETGQLRVDPEEARDVLWNHLAIDSYERLVLGRGWSLQRYTAWMTHSVLSALCA